MLAKRLIACLDVKDGLVVKGIQFKQHEVVGDIIQLSKFYSDMCIDELVFYDISASSNNSILDNYWIKNIAKVINIPFTVAGGITSIKKAAKILALGADKISINSPALNNPSLIRELSNIFGKQCIVVGIDSWYNKINHDYEVFKYTGNNEKTEKTLWRTIDWIQKVQELGAGEIVLNCMNVDGVQNGFDIQQLKIMQSVCSVPLIASGGAGKMSDFLQVFLQSKVDGALAASVFHKKIISINTLKKFLFTRGVNIRKC